ncbi:protein TIFY 5A [Momordica charantia]|uniref:Protein TIFY n=1 Tax=Momordica charantia TaxID=3673 RepID=A0A6J1CDV5_MOMCH|nr:protein TIFY 5A [Momordica charantia]
MAVLPVSMERNCNLELRLSPSTSFSGHDSGDQQPRLHHFLGEESSKNPQQMTIFYNGRVCVGDFTEEQARAIIMLATRHTKEEKTTCRRQTLEPSSPEQTNSGAGAGSVSGISMKKSLQRFLQKRKHRIQSASPYHH